MVGVAAAGGVDQVGLRKGRLVERLTVARVDPAAANAVGDHHEFHALGQQGVGCGIDLGVTAELPGKIERHDTDVRERDERSDFRTVALRAAVEPVSRNPVVGQSARNRMVGLVTKVTRDTVMAQVEVQAGPFRLVSLVSREAA